MTRLIWADCETTGIRPGRGGEIWELALIVRDEPGSAVSDTERVWQVRPDLELADSGSLAIGRYYERGIFHSRGAGAAKHTHPVRDEDGDLALLGLVSEVAQEVARLLDGASLIGANPAFEAGHLDRFLRQHGQALTADYHYTDLGSLVRGWAHGSFVNAKVPFPLRLADAARLARINPGDYELHTALGDARLARDIFDVVTGGAP